MTKELEKLFAPVFGTSKRRQSGAYKVKKAKVRGPTSPLVEWQWVACGQDCASQGEPIEPICPDCSGAST